MADKDEDAMGRAMEDYAKRVMFSPMDDGSKTKVIREANEYLHKMFEALDQQRGLG